MKLSKLFNNLYLKLAFIAVILSLAVMTTASGKEQTAQVVFNQNGNEILTLVHNKVEIVPGLSKAQLEQANLKNDPAAIKVLMQKMSKDYNVDWKLVYAIGYLESGKYNSHLARNNNNFFGRKAVGGGYASWETPEEGIRNQFEYLQRRYFARGLDTPVKINKVYAEDPNWHVKVSSLIAKL